VEEQASGAQEGSVPGTGWKAEAPGLTSSQIFTRVQWLGNDVAMLIGPRRGASATQHGVGAAPIELHNFGEAKEVPRRTCEIRTAKKKLLCSDHLADKALLGVAFI
jgi:hypothetical protein